MIRMKLELNNLVYTTDDAVKIERLKELGAVPVEEKTEEEKTEEEKTKEEKTEKEKPAKKEQK